MRRWEPNDEGTNSDRWLLSYADFITLLLATFVVLYAMSATNTRNMEELLSGVRSAFVPMGEVGNGVLDGLPTAGSARQSRGTISSQGKTSSGFEFLRLRDRITSAIGGSGGEDSDANASGVRVRTTDRGLLISLASSGFFDAGGVEIQPEALQMLETIAAVLRTTTQPLRIEGHTDDLPMHSKQYPSNWELSTTRAAVVARLLVDDYHIDPSRLGAAGYAHHRPLVPNDTAENRAINRRIDIVLLQGDAAEEEPPGADTPEGQETLRRILDQLPPIE